MYDLSKLLENRIARGVNFLRVSGLGCIIISVIALSLNRTAQGWLLDAITLLSIGLAIAGGVAFLSGALFARILRKFGSHQIPDLALNQYEGEK